VKKAPPRPEPVPLSRDEHEARDAEILREAHRLPPYPVTLIREVADAEQAFQSSKARSIGGFIRTCPAGVNPFAAPSLFHLIYDCFSVMDNRYDLARNPHWPFRYLDDFARTILGALPRLRRGHRPRDVFAKMSDQARIARVAEVEGKLRKLIGATGPPGKRDKQHFTAAVMDANNRLGLWKDDKVPRFVGEVLFASRKASPRGPLPLDRVAVKIAERFPDVNAPEVRREARRLADQARNSKRK
jgi:hypothetical protein